MSLSLISIVKSLSSKIKHTYGWRVTILYSAIGTFVTLLLNVILLVLSLSRRGSYVGGGIITLFDGSCATSNYISTTSHILINFLSTTLLAASNLGMQCLLAPTREDVDNAHSRGSWLHIGVLSLKNLQGVPRIRRVVFTILSLSSMPLHFLYNSVIFSSVSTNYYNFAVVPDSFLRGADWKTSDPYAGADSPDFTWLRQIQNRSSNLAHLDIEKCAQAFSNSYQSAYGDSLLVYKPSIESEPATVFGFGGDSSNRGVLTWCSEQDSCTYNGTSLVWNPFHNDNSDDDTLDVWVKIDYCAAVKTSEQCRVYVSYVFLVVVIICNGAKFVCFLYLLIPDDWQPLITIGDSIADFLRHWGDATEIIRGPSDTKTENNAQIQSKTVEIKDYHSNVEDDIQVSPRRRWASSPSRVRWVVTLLCFCAIWSAALILLLTSDRTLTWSSFGSIQLDCLLFQQQSGTLFANVMLANLPQFLISTAYVAYSGLITCMFASREFGQFCRQRRGLRVSNPYGAQRSTPWLSTPYRYALPLTVSMALLHWTASQSIFLARVDAYYGDFEHEPDEKNDINTVGWSPAAIMSSLIVSSVLIAILPVLGTKRFPDGVPVVSSSSLAIRAVCHKSSRDETDLDTKLIQLGRLPDKGADGKRKIGFSAYDVESLVPNHDKNKNHSSRCKKFLNHRKPQFLKKRKWVPASVAVLVGLGSTAAGG